MVWERDGIKQPARKGFEEIKRLKAEAKESQESTQIKSGQPPVSPPDAETGQTKHSKEVAKTIAEKVL